MNRILLGCFNILGIGYYLVVGGRVIIIFLVLFWRGVFLKKGFWGEGYDDFSL